MQESETGQGVDEALAPDEALTDVIERSVESPVPIAVVDDKGRLLGAIPRVVLLAALGNVEPTTTEIPIIDVPMTVPVAELTATLEAVSAANQPVIATEGSV